MIPETKTMDCNEKTTNKMMNKQNIKHIDYISNTFSDKFINTFHVKKFQGRLVQFPLR